MLYQIFEFIRPFHFYLLCFFIVCLILLFLIASLHFRKKRKELYQAIILENNIRHYTIYFKEQTVIYFDHMNMKKTVHIRLQDLIDSIAIEDQSTFSVWIKEICKQNPMMPRFFESTFLSKLTNDHVMNLYLYTLFDAEKEILQLDSYLFPQLSQTRMHNHKKVIFSQEELFQTMQQPKQTRHLATYVLRLYPTFESTSKEKEAIIHLLIAQIMNGCGHLLSKHRWICCLRSTEICFIHRKMKSKPQAIAYGEKLQHIVSRFVHLQSSYAQYDFKLGISFQDTPLPLKECIRNAKEIANYARNAESNETVVLYDENINLNISYHSMVVDEVISLISRSDSLQTLYTPILHQKDAQLTAYLCDYRLHSNIIHSFDELIDTASSSGMSEELFKLALSVSFFTSPRPSLRKVNVPQTLLMPMPFSLQESIENWSLPPVKKFWNIVLIVEEEDLVSLLNQREHVLRNLTFLRKKGFTFALFLQSFSLDLPSNYLSHFDYFILRPNLVHRILSETQGKILFSNLKIRLKNCAIPFIATEVKTWAGVELLLSLQVDYIAGDALAPATQHVTEVSKKVTQKMMDLSKK